MAAGQVNCPAPLSVSGTPASVASCSFSRTRLQGFFKELRHQCCCQRLCRGPRWHAARGGRQRAAPVQSHGAASSAGGALVLDGNHRCLALVTVQEIDKLYDPPLGYAMHRQEQW